MVLATSIELIKNLVDLEYDGRKFDLHNEYDCERVIFENESLLFLLKKIDGNESLKLTFYEIYFTSFEFFNVTKVQNLTIDSMYRGRAIVGDKLMEQSEDGKGFFYIEFYEGQKIEFWSKGLAIEIK